MWHTLFYIWFIRTWYAHALNRITFFTAEEFWWVSSIKNVIEIFPNQHFAIFPKEEKKKKKTEESGPQTTSKEILLLDFLYIKWL
jgi:hypothetical protein